MFSTVDLRQHKHTDEKYPGDNCTSKMANVRGLLVLSLVCLLLCQMMTLSEACPKTKCTLQGCGIYCCNKGHTCLNNCMCGWANSWSYPLKC
ncbi:hypothetical protein LSAT2_012667 [Lamellibrachia satsuma]|nr:hypothetical protein LSAT2_012667 [Lamellibrachia satsuma]